MRLVKFRWRVSLQIWGRLLLFLAIEPTWVPGVVVATEPVVSAMGQSGGEFRLEIKEAAGGVVVQESRDFFRWHDLTFEAEAYTGAKELRVHATNGNRFFRTRAGTRLAHPPELSTNDIFQPYVRRVPEVTTVFQRDSQAGYV